MSDMIINTISLMHLHALSFIQMYALIIVTMMEYVRRPMMAHPTVIVNWGMAATNVNN